MPSKRETSSQYGDIISLPPLFFYYLLCVPNISILLIMTDLDMDCSSTYSLIFSLLIYLLGCLFLLELYQPMGGRINAACLCICCF